MNRSIVLCLWRPAALILVSSIVTAGPAAAKDLTAWQEIAVLTVSRLDTAASNCGFRVNESKVRVMLYSAELSLDTVKAGPRPASLQSQIDADAASFRADREAACKRAWDTFGADAVPGARDLLLR